MEHVAYDDYVPDDIGAPPQHGRDGDEARGDRRNYRSERGRYERGGRFDRNRPGMQGPSSGKGGGKGGGENGRSLDTPSKRSGLVVYNRCAEGYTIGIVPSVHITCEEAIAVFNVR